jgi:hypothetical protein
MAVRLKVARLPKLNVPTLSRTETRKVGQAVQGAAEKRIASAKKPDVSQAKPLAVHVAKSGRRYGYAIQKQKKAGRNKRDWRGIDGANPEHAMDALRTTVSEPGTALVKFPASVAKRMAIRENSDEMFGMGLMETEAGTAEAQKHWAKAVKRANQ